MNNRGFLNVALTGPVFEPASQKVHQLVILIHGYGSTGEDLLGVAPPLSSYVPNALFCAPDGPYPWEGDSLFGGRQWFSLPDLSQDTLSKGVASTLPCLNQFLDQLLDNYGLTENQVALIGFSQGAMIVLSWGLSRERPVGAVVAYSGLFADSEDQPVRSRPPVLLVHGDQDTVVPRFYCELAQDRLKKRGVSVTSRICQNVGHSIDAQGLQVAGTFIQQHLLPSNTAYVL